MGRNRFQKFCYWVDSRELKNIKRDLSRQGISIEIEGRIPCRVLRPSQGLVYVDSRAWNGICKRRCSWYWKSVKAKKVLLVSDKPLDQENLKRPIVILESDFRPNRFPAIEEVQQLVSSREYQHRKPRQWEKVNPIEKEFYKKWFERFEEREVYDFERIFSTHSGNHSNFISPKWFVTVKGRTAPYSIADSLHTCSSCLEFFDILGTEWPLKYVVPCLGAVHFANLTMNRYYEVRSGQDE